MENLNLRNSQVIGEDEEYYSSSEDELSSESSLSEESPIEEKLNEKIFSREEMIKDLIGDKTIDEFFKRSMLYQCIKCLDIKKIYLFPKEQWDRPLVCGDCSINEEDLNNISGMLLELFDNKYDFNNFTNLLED